MTIVDEDWTETRDANTGRMDLVDKSANGVEQFLLMKADASNIMSPDMVEQLLVKADEVTAKPGQWLKKDAIVKDGVEPDIDAVLVEPTGADLAASQIPASPEWEQVDSDTAANAYAVLARVDNTLGLLAGREEAEAFNGAPDGDENAYMLSDAQAAVEYAMDTVAVYAASEQIDAEPVEKALTPVEQIVKAVTGLEDSLRTVELLGTLKKAGRTLSAQNESKLRSASDQITSVLASLPAATDEVTKKEALVAEKTVDEAPIVKTEETPVVAEPVEVVKADATDAAGFQAVFDQNGNLVGVVDPSAIQAVTGAGADTDPDPEPAAVDPDAAPAPAEVGSPTDVTKSSDEIEKSEPVTRAEIAELVKGLKDEIEFLKAPASPRAFTNGATGVVSRDGEVLKGADDADSLIKASQDAPDSATRTKIDNQRGLLARELLAASRPTA